MDKLHPEIVFVVVLELMFCIYVYYLLLVFYLFVFLSFVFTFVQGSLTLRATFVENVIGPLCIMYIYVMKHKLNRWLKKEIGRINKKAPV